MDLSNIPREQLIELSGIEPPKRLPKAVEQAAQKLERARTTLAETKEELVRIEAAKSAKAESFASKIADAVVSGKATAKIEKEKDSALAEMERQCQSAKDLLSALERKVIALEADCTAANAALTTFCDESLIANQKRMREELDRVTNERGRSASTQQRMTSKSPNYQAKSRIMMCESCRSPIGTFDPAKLRQPIMGSMFMALPRLSQPFPDACPSEHFHCPTCRKFCTGEPDKILVSDGFRMVPEVEPEPEPETAG
ncbi:hypothetical protein DSCO28_30390 [Desulfosarcina ovata subsp. sediminis]|uniref:Uncharacterized protein n=1 Tax=Desulfosarcina ovata subsp. sediminis TaxID=885957 RepID=A0A5K7ZRQ8_9BACT|nr:hypothetical protein [Desulfosarcina ovata]BBO82473.1 hypothetical protein DSCO28_30390 [Desulfosarcina ovata subsp. sediminis]